MFAHEILHQAVADALGDAPLDLRLGHRGIDEVAAVGGGHEVDDPHAAGLLVDLDLHRVAAEAVAHREVAHARFRIREVAGGVVAGLGHDLAAVAHQSRKMLD